MHNMICKLILYFACRYFKFKRDRGTKKYNKYKSELE